MPRPFPRRPFRTQIAVVVALALIALWKWQFAPQNPPPSAAPHTGNRPTAEQPGSAEQPGRLSAGTYRIDHVVDGDTLKLTTGERVRLIGVDTPESVKPDTPVQPWGPEASAFTKRFLASGQVRLEFDREKHDDYGRLLAYAYAMNPATGQEEMLNEQLLRAGLARALLRHPYSKAMKERFRIAEQQARRAKLGIWSDGR